MTHTQTELNYSFRCSYTARHVLFFLLLPVSPAAGRSAGWRRGCHRGGGRGPAAPFVPEPASPPPPDPARPRGTEPPLWPPEKGPTPPPLSPAPGSCSVLAATAAALGLDPQCPGPPGGTGPQQLRAEGKGEARSGRAGSKCHGRKGGRASSGPHVPGAGRPGREGAFLPPAAAR